MIRKRHLFKVRKGSEKQINFEIGGLVLLLLVAEKNGIQACQPKQTAIQCGSISVQSVCIYDVDQDSSRKNCQHGSCGRIKSNWPDVALEK